MTVLAEISQAAADPMISGNWLLGLLGALTTAAVAIIGKLKVDAAKREKSSVVETLATKDEMRALEDRLVAEIKKLEGAISKERDIARTANGNLHARIDKSAEALAAMNGQLIQISANLNRLIDLALNTPRTPRTPR